MMKQVEVQIMGQSYLLAAPEGGEQRLITAVEKVDTAMCKIRDAGKVKARDRIAVLAALNLAFEAEAQARTNPNINSATSAAGAAPDSASANTRLAQLIAKLDQALLTPDGQLL